MTNTQKLQIASSTLSNIRPPVAFAESIIIPIYQALMLIDEVRKDLESEKDISISDVKVTSEDPGPDVEEISR